MNILKLLGMRIFKGFRKKVKAPWSKYYNKEDKYKEYLHLYNQLLNSKNENISNNNNL